MHVSRSTSRLGRLTAAAVCLSAAAAAAEPARTEVAFEGDGGLELKGTLVVPEGAGDERRAAVLLLPGSGPTDRDGNQAPTLTTDLLKQIAERLAEAGVATLRFDKRACPTYQESWPKDPEEVNAYFGWEEFVGDATAAYRFLRDRAEVDPSRVMIAGHSEGGLIALQIGHDLADGELRPAGLVLMATAGRTLDVVLREQVERSLRAQGAGDAIIERYLAATDSAIAAVKAREPLPALPPGLAPIFNPTVPDILHSYFTTDPAELAKAFNGPVLIVQGEDDAQVSAERDAPRLAEALKARPEGTVEVVIVESASHHLKPAGEGPMSGVTGPVVGSAMEALALWVRTHAGKP